MPFDNGTKSCWTFIYDLHQGNIAAERIPELLELHAIQCNCPCPPCQRLKQMWVEDGVADTNGSPKSESNL